MPSIARCVKIATCQTDGASMAMLLPPENKKDSALVRDFMGHLVTGGGLFLLAGAVSMLIEFAADFADGFPKFGIWR